MAEWVWVFLSFFFCKSTQCNSLHTCPWYGNAESGAQITFWQHALEASFPPVWRRRWALCLKKLWQIRRERGSPRARRRPPNPSSRQAWSPFTDTESAPLFVWIENLHSAVQSLSRSFISQKKKKKAWYKLQKAHGLFFFKGCREGESAGKHSDGESSACMHNEMIHLRENENQMENLIPSRTSNK